VDFLCQTSGGQFRRTTPAFSTLAQTSDGQFGCGGAFTGVLDPPIIKLTMLVGATIARTLRVANNISVNVAVASITAKDLLVSPTPAVELPVEASPVATVTLTPTIPVDANV
jgi:hypothetical protein